MGYKKTKGFTLIESVIAISIITFLGIGVVSTVVYARHSSEMEKQRNNALVLASTVMENLKQKLFSTIAPYTQNVVIDDNGTAATNDDLPGTLQVIVKDKYGNTLTGPPATNSRISVEIVVAWHPVGSPSRKILEERLISEIAP
jgi:prepilin-type N-terminal cleavage/methylation domain-containing protein